MKRYNVTVNGKAYDVTVEEVGGAVPAAPVAPVAPVAAAPVAAPAPAAPAAPAAPVASGKVNVNAPMPGTVLRTNVSVGDKVEKGQVLLVLEAMKMENDITAPEAGTVSFMMAKGSTVKTGDLIVSLS